MKRVRKMIIGSDYDATLDLAGLQAAAVGDIALLDPRTNGIPAAGTAEEIVVATLCADSDGNTFTEFSDPISLRGISSASSSTWAPSTPKIQEVTISAITPTAGEVFELIITDYNDYNYIVSPRRIYYEAATGDTETEVAAGLAAQINADVSMPNLTATSALGVITVTGAAVRGSGQVINNFRADYEILFDVNAGEGLIGITTVATTQAPDKGCGTFREVRKMEEDHKGFKGHLNRVIYPTSVNIQYKSVSGTEYDLMVIEFASPQHTQTEGDVHFQQTLTVAIDRTAATESAAGLFADIQALR